MTIKHLVIAGGGPSGIATCGFIHCLLESKYIDINEIQTIHATSAGTVNAIFLCLHKLSVDYASIKNYIFKRPLHETYKINVQDILQLYNNKGIYTVSITDTFFKPFYNLLNIPIHITMLEFYQLTGIELYFYSVNIHSVELTPLSFKTTPDLPINHAVYMSSCIPIIFSPHSYKDNYYIDGGFLCNYPIQQCIEMVEKNENTMEKVAGIHIQYTKSDIIEKNKEYLKCSSNNNIIEFFFIVCYNLVLYLNNIFNTKNIFSENVINIPIHLNMSFECIKSLIFHEEERLALYNNGYEKATAFLKTKL